MQTSMQAHGPRFWILTFVLGILVTAHSLQTWHGTPTGPHAILETKNVLHDVEQAHIGFESGDSSAATPPISSKHALNNSTLGFQKIFAINLPARMDKRDGMLLASKVTGFDIEFVEGVEPALIQSKALPHKYPAQHALPTGGIGCWRAHMNVLAKIVQDNLATALILEDDADWDVRLLSQLE